MSIVKGVIVVVEVIRIESLQLLISLIVFIGLTRACQEEGQLFFLGPLMENLVR
jgi:hypothetical protein